MLGLSLGLSAALLAVSNVIIAASKNPRGIYLLGWLGILPGVLLFSQAYFLHALLLAIVATLCGYYGVSWRVFLPLSIVTFVVAYGYVGWNAKQQLDHVARVYPMESVAERLAYETARPKTADAKAALLRDTTDDDLPTDRFALKLREQSLRTLHENYVSAFIDSEEFGQLRMMRMCPSEIIRFDKTEQEKPTILPEPSSPGFQPNSTSEGQDPLQFSADAKPAGIDARDMHGDSLRDFLNPYRFGYVRDREHVAGFQSHQLSSYPGKYAREKSFDKWRIQSLELVSLLKHPQPIVYLSDHLPRMDELRNAKTRPLDEFEQEQLAKLQAGESVIAASAENRLRMLGAIRAKAECLKCHNAEQNELLGAFSYDLRRDQRLPD